MAVGSHNRLLEGEEEGMDFTGESAMHGRGASGQESGP